MGLIFKLGYLFKLKHFKSIGPGVKMTNFSNLLRPKLLEKKEKFVNALCRHQMA